MTERIEWTAFVPIGRIEAFRAAGWEFFPLSHPHAFYAVGASWPLDTEPVWPDLSEAAA